jgi:hypothetical protein
MRRRGARVGAPAPPRADLSRLFTEENKKEGFTKVTLEIEQMPGGFSRLTVTHDFEGAPIMAGAVKSKFNAQGGGRNYILSDLKSLLETGKIMAS